jgi:hypothetical protein
MALQRGTAKWTAIHDRWLAYRVPAVDLVLFELGKHYSRAPWLDRKTGKQSIGTTNPQQSTAYHLAVVLPESSGELKIAYMLYSFLKDENRYHSGWKVLVPIFERNHSALHEWWAGNARNLLPPLDYVAGSMRDERREENWNQIVDDAASTWRRVANEWSVVQIPDFMDHDSPEYISFAEHESKRNEVRERA